MRYPIGKSSSSLDPLWYNAQGFGASTSYGFHDGWDLNLRTGGDSDLGQPLYAVADGTIRYYHNASHPTTGFGRHMVLECDTPRGKRWYHYAHCQEITSQVRTVKEGDVIGKLGNSGTQWAHLHFSVFKVNPSTLYKGIDSVATNSTNLNNWWEKFTVQSGAGSPPDMSKELQTCLADREKFWKERDEARAELEAEKIRHQETKGTLSLVRKELNDERDDRVRDLEKIAVKLNVDATTSAILPAIETALTYEDKARELLEARQEDKREYDDNIARLEKTIEGLQKQLNSAMKEIERLKEEKPISDPVSPRSWIEIIKQLFGIK